MRPKVRSGRLRGRFALRGSVRSQGTTIASAPAAWASRRHRFDRRGVAADQRQACALRGEGHGDRRAHALGRAGDHRDPSFELQVHCRFIPCSQGAIGRVRFVRRTGPRLSFRTASSAASAAGGRNAGVKISSTDGVRGSSLASTRMSIDFFSRAVVDVAEADLGDLGMVHLVLAAWRRSARARPSTLISGSRLATAATAAVGVLERVDRRPG